MRHPVVADVREIAVLRASGMGDFVFALPALVALSAAYPDARVTLLGLPWHAELLDGRPGPVHRVVVLPPIPGISAPQCDQGPVGQPSSPWVRALLGPEPVDLALQLHGGGRASNPFVRSLGARVTVGSASLDAVALDRTVSYQYLQHEVLRLLEVVGLVGATPLGIAPCLAVTEEDRALSSSVLLGPRYAVLVPGAGDPRRCWSTEDFAAVGDRLASRGRSVAIVGGAADRERCHAVADDMRHRGHVLAPGAGGLGGLVGLLADAELVVGNDTGPLHLAAAVGTATVGIYWGPNLVNAGPLRADRHRVVAAWSLACPACGVVNVEERCDHDVSFVTAASRSEVLAQVDDLLAQ
jgi:ADP-heptose:LPS heptosyltransferase